MRHFLFYALFIMLWNKFAIVEIETLWLSRIEIWGSWFMSIFSIFSVMLDGLQRCFSCCSLPILLCNGQNIAEYESYWLMGFPIINLWGARFTSEFSVFSVMVGWIAEILVMLFFACVTNATKLSMKQTGL